MVKNTKIKNLIIDLISNISLDLCYYGEFGLYINFIEDNSIPTCGVNVTKDGMNFNYNEDFVNSLDDKELLFIYIHEIYHLNLNHYHRIIDNGYDFKLSNVAQDMVINHLIWKHNHIRSEYIKLPTTVMPLLIPNDYNGKLLFEDLYLWLQDEKEKYEDSKLDKEYVKYRNKHKDPTSDKKYITSYFLEDIFNDLDNKNGNFMDIHLDSSISDENSNRIIEEINSTLKAKGIENGILEKMVSTYSNKDSSYISMLKKEINNSILKSERCKTISRPSRRGISGIKGKKKNATMVNCILDTSASMSDVIESVISYISSKSIIINLITCDTEVREVITIKNNNQLKNIRLKGFGGTILQPSIDVIVKEYPDSNTLLITDGYCDNLDMTKLRGKVIILTTGIDVVYKGNNVRQVKITP